MIRPSSLLPLLVALVASPATATSVRGATPKDAVDAHAGLVPAALLDMIAQGKIATEKLTQFAEHKPKDDAAGHLLETRMNLTGELLVAVQQLWLLTEQFSIIMKAANWTSSGVAKLKSIQPIAHEVAANTSGMLEPYMAALSECQKRRDEVRSAWEQTQHDVAVMGGQIWLLEQEFQGILAAYLENTDNVLYLKALSDIKQRRDSIKEAEDAAKGNLTWLDPQYFKAEQDYQVLLSSLPWVKGALAIPSAIDNVTTAVLPDAIALDKKLHKLMEKHADQVDDNLKQAPALVKPWQKFQAAHSGAQRSAAAVQSVLVVLFALGVGAFGFRA